MASSTPNPNPRVVTVTLGLSSFIGRSLASALLRDGNFTVRIADPLPPRSQSDRILHFQTDFGDPSSLRRAILGSSAVFHVDPTASAVVGSPRAADFYSSYAVTVATAKNVIRVCRDCRVKRLVYTGSADVVGFGVDIDGMDESALYPNKFTDDLSELRAQVEKLILNANGRDGFSTCVLRSSNPFGPGDEFVPFLVGAKFGWAKFIVGSGRNMWDFTYVENVAHANICAEEALRSGSASVAGQSFFITNHERVKLWDFISTILEGLGYSRPNIHIPVKGILLLQYLADCLCGKLGLYRANNPFTPAVICSLSCTRTFDSSKAQRLIGYSPIFSLEDGVALTVESFSHLAKGLSYSRQREYLEPSKAESLLGSGKVAEILLWRDQKLTFTCLLGLFLLFHWFLLSGRTFVSSTAKFLLLLTMILFVQGNLPSSVFGFPVQKIPASYFEISEVAVRHSLITVASFWNLGFHILKLVAKGDNWNAFIKVAAFPIFSQAAAFFLHSIGWCCIDLHVLPLSYTNSLKTKSIN